MTQDALEALENHRHEWSCDHGYTEPDTGAWILKEEEEIYLEAIDDCIEKIKALTQDTLEGALMKLHPSEDAGFFKDGFGNWWAGIGTRIEYCDKYERTGSGASPLEALKKAMGE